MQIYNRKYKPAAVTIEIALSILLGTIALFLVFGYFNNNLSEMAMQNNSKKIFDNQDTKISFESKNRDYSDSIIDINR